MTDNAQVQATFSTEQLVEMWKIAVPDYHLSVSDLLPTVKTSVMMGALLEILSKLGVDREAIIKPPPEGERDEHTEYYWDLIPIINMTRVLNHVLNLPFKIKLLDLLNPSPRSAHDILLLLVNFANFYTTRRDAIEPRENELFQQEQELAALEQERDDLLTQVNEQSAAIGSRQMRLKELDANLQAASKDLKKQRQAHEETQRELDTILEENEGLQAQLDKRKLQKEALLAELARVKAQKVNDAEDVKAQFEMAVRTEKEVTEQLDVLKEALCSKEAVVRNLQAVHSLLQEGMQDAQEISTLTNSLQEMQTAESRQEAEVEAALGEREAALGEASAALDDVRAQRDALALQRQQDLELAGIARAKALRTAKEAESTARAAADKAREALEAMPGLEAALENHAATKKQLEQQLQDLKIDFQAKLRSHEELLLRQSKLVAKHLDDKLGKLARK